MTSLITSEVDFARDGKQSGYLRLPHSKHESAYGWIPVPVVVINNGEGPTILLTAGIHGDEYEGQIALGKLARELEPDAIRGRVIILPMVSQPAAQAGTRTSPIDGGNLNRAFPGQADGNPTQVLAHYIEEILLPMCDYLVDLHSGGTSLFYPPTLLRGQGHTQFEAERLLVLQNAFDLPYAWVFTSGGGPNSTARTAMGAANRKGVISVMAELGGGGAVTKDILSQCERGLRRVLNALRMLPGFDPGEQRGTRECHSAGSVFARDVGLFEPFKEIGEDVGMSESTGRIHFPDQPDRPPADVPSPFDGLVLCKRALGRVEIGDAVFQIAQDAKQQ